MFETIMILCVGAAIGIGGMWVILMVLLELENDRKDQDL
jgi:hypothetical protein